MHEEPVDDEPEEQGSLARLIAAIVEHLPLMVFVKDAKTLRFRLLNRAGEDLLGLNRDEIVGRRDADVFPESEAQFFEEVDRAVLETGDVVDIPVEPVRTRSGERLLHTRKVTLRNAADEPVYLLGISEDITERTQDERERTMLVERLKKAVREREDLLAIVSHDLRNPVGAILMSSEMLARTGAASADGARLQDIALRIRRAASHMSDLIDNLVDAAALESGQISVVRQPEDVGSLVDEALELMMSRAAEKAQELVCDIRGPLPPVNCDRGRILQVLNNLVGNAIKFTPEGGRIAVSAHAAGEVVRLTVADTGPGIPADVVPHVFDRYWQAKRSSRSGAGLGLFIVKGIVEAHGGRVWAESRPGAGSSFHVELPACVQ